MVGKYEITFGKSLESNPKLRRLLDAPTELLKSILQNIYSDIVTEAHWSLAQGSDGPVATLSLSDDLAGSVEGVFTPADLEDLNGEGEFLLRQLWVELLRNRGEALMRRMYNGAHAETADAG